MKKRIVLVLLLLISFFNFNNAFAAMLYEGELNSAVVYMVNKKTGAALIEKNIDEKRSPASLTKIMTFIIVYENCKDIDNTKVRVTQRVLDMVDPESSGCTLRDGEEFSVAQLLHCMMICSSGHASMVLADFIGGSAEQFVDMMNAKSEILGCTNTHFTNSDGIYNENQYSTATDMYKITCYAMENPLFMEIVGKGEYSLFGDERDPIITTNKMIDSKRGGEYYYPYVKGIKTGYVEEAGRCLISYAEKNDAAYIAVVMGGSTHDTDGVEANFAMIDTKNIYKWAFENLKITKLYSQYFPLQEIKLEFALGKDTLVLISQSDFFADLPKSAKMEDVSLKYNIPEKVYAPVEEGQVFGTAEIFYNNQKLGSINLVSNETIKKNVLVIIYKWIIDTCKSPVFWILSAVILAAALVYVRAAIIRIKNKRRRNKVKRFPRINLYKP